MFWSHWRPRHYSQHHQCDLFPRVWFILTQPLGPTLALLQTKAHSASLRQPERAKERHHNSWSICLDAGGPSFIPGTAVPQARPRVMPEHAQEPGIASSIPPHHIRKKKIHYISRNRTFPDTGNRTFLQAWSSAGRWYSGTGRNKSLALKPRGCPLYAPFIQATLEVLRDHSRYHMWCRGLNQGQSQEYSPPSPLFRGADCS